MNSDTPHLHIVITAGGTMTMEAKNFGGSLCRTASGPYMAKIGGVEDTPTAEAKEDPNPILLTEQAKETY